MIRLSTLVLSALLAAGAAAPVAMAASIAGVPDNIAAVVTDPARPDADKALNETRKPGKVATFAGVKPGMTIVELFPGGGFYTRILAKIVGPTGKIYAIMPAAFASRPGAMDALNAIAAANPNVVVMSADLNTFTVPTKADMVWTTENYHDFHNGPTANIALMNKTVFNVLKPGGIYYVEDYQAAPGAGLAVTSTVHRMDEAIAKQELAAAGFRLEAEGSDLPNPMDDPTTRSKFSAARFQLRMKKP